LPEFYIDEEEGIIRGRTLNTRDSITFYGKTVDEALQAFRDSVDDYLEFCAEIGVEPEKPYSGKLLIRLKPEVHRELSLIAQRNGQRINSFVAGELELVVKQSGPLGLSPGRVADGETLGSSPTTGKPKGVKNPAGTTRTPNHVK
jgi:predicted HicB family RNase H-like nuclease